MESMCVRLPLSDGDLTCCSFAPQRKDLFTSKLMICLGQQVSPCLSSCVAGQIDNKNISLCLDLGKTWSEILPTCLNGLSRMLYKLTKCFGPYSLVMLSLDMNRIAIFSKYGKFQRFCCHLLFKYHQTNWLCVCCRELNARSHTKEVNVQ